MPYFTESNTEGFTAAELLQMNRALDMLAADGFENDENHVSDFINNQYTPGTTAEEYVMAYKAR